jgi:translation initiation factor IF-3
VTHVAVYAVQVARADYEVPPAPTQQQDPIRPEGAPTTAPPTRSKSRADPFSDDSDGDSWGPPPPRQRQDAGGWGPPPQRQRQDENADPFLVSSTPWDAPTQAPERRPKERSGSNAAYDYAAAPEAPRAPPGAPMFAPQRRSKQRADDVNAPDSRPQTGRPSVYAPFPGRGGYRNRSSGSRDEEEFAGGRGGYANTYGGRDRDSGIGRRSESGRWDSGPDRRQIAEDAAAFGMVVNDRIRCAVLADWLHHMSCHRVQVVPLCLLAHKSRRHRRQEQWRAIACHRKHLQASMSIKSGSSVDDAHACLGRCHIARHSDLAAPHQWRSHCPVPDMSQYNCVYTCNPTACRRPALRVCALTSQAHARRAGCGRWCADSGAYTGQACARRAREVRVLDGRKEMVGVMPLDEALQMAYDDNQDLIQLNENVDPPLVRICAVSKYKYELDQEKKEQSKKQRENKMELKELVMSPRTQEHDLKARTLTFCIAGLLLVQPANLQVLEPVHAEVAMRALCLTCIRRLLRTVA